MVGGLCHSKTSKQQSDQVWRCSELGMLGQEVLGVGLLSGLS